MRGLYAALVFAAVFGLAAPAQAAGHGQVDGVNIVYPIDGSTYPNTDPVPGVLSSAFITASFSVTCPGQTGNVEWAFDSTGSLGSVAFYEQTSVQFVYKLPGGNRAFKVSSTCGQNRDGLVEFKVGQ